MCQRRFMSACTAIAAVALPALAIGQCDVYSRNIRGGVIETPGRVFDLLPSATDDDLLYALDGTGELLVIDVTNPMSGLVVAARSIPVTARAMVIEGSRLLIGSAGGVHVFELADPVAPVLSDSLQIPGGCGAICAAGDLALTVGADSTLSVIGLDGGTRLLSSLRMPGAPIDVALEGDLAAVSLGLDGIQLVGLADRGAPQLRGSYDGEPMGLYDNLWHRDVEFRGGYVHVIQTDWYQVGHDCPQYWLGLRSISTADPDVPREGGVISLGEPPYGLVTLRVNGTRWTVPRLNGVVVLDASGPLPVRTIDLDVPWGGVFAIVDDFAYVPKDGGLLVYEGLNPWETVVPSRYSSELLAAAGSFKVTRRMPEELWFFNIRQVGPDGSTTCDLLSDVGSELCPGCADFPILDAKVTCLEPPYVAWTGQWDYSDPTPWHTLIKFTGGCWDHLHAFMPAPVRAIVDDRAVTVERASGGGTVVQVHDVSGLPEVLPGGTLELSPTLSTPLHSWHRGHRLYLLDADDLVGIDLETGDPSLVFHGSPPAGAFGAVEGDRLYMLRDGGIDLYDIADPQVPALLSRFVHPLELREVTAFGDFVYARIPGGVLVIRWKNPAAPSPVGILPAYSPGGFLAATPTGVYWSAMSLDCDNAMSHWRARLACAPLVSATISSFEVSTREGRGLVSWRLSAPAEPHELRLTVSCGGREQDLSFGRSQDEFHAEHVLADACGASFEGAATLTYRLWNWDGEGWSPLAERTLAAALDQGLPSRTGLAGVWPNPFNPCTEIAFDVRTPQRVEMTIHDLAGRQVARLLAGVLQAGRHTAKWSGLDERGRPLPAGHYLVRMATPEGVSSRKLTMIR